MKEHDCNEGKQRTAFKNQSTCKTYSTILYVSITHDQDIANSLPIPIVSQALMWETEISSWQIKAVS